MAYVTNNQIMENILADITYACAHWIQQIETSIPYVKLNGKCVEDKWFDSLQRGGKLIIIDNDEYNIHPITYTNLSKAISLVRKYPQFKYETSWDETFADCIMQIAIFNEIIFD